METKRVTKEKITKVKASVPKLEPKFTPKVTAGLVKQLTENIAHAGHLKCTSYASIMMTEGALSVLPVLANNYGIVFTEADFMDICKLLGQDRRYTPKDTDATIRYAEGRKACLLALKSLLYGGTYVMVF